MRIYNNYRYTFQIHGNSRDGHFGCEDGYTLDRGAFLHKVSNQITVWIFKFVGIVPGPSWFQLFCWWKHLHRSLAHLLWADLIMLCVGFVPKNRSMSMTFFIYLDLLEVSLCWTKPITPAWFGPCNLSCLGSHTFVRWPQPSTCLLTRSASRLTRHAP